MPIVRFTFTFQLKCIVVDCFFSTYLHHSNLFKRSSVPVPSRFSKVSIWMAPLLQLIFFLCQPSSYIDPPQTYPSFPKSNYQFSLKRIVLIH